MLVLFQTKVFENELYFLILGISQINNIKIPFRAEIDSFKIMIQSDVHTSQAKIYKKLLLNYCVERTFNQFFFYVSLL